MHNVTFDPRKTVRVTLIGVGGTGSLLLTHLVRLDQAVRALGGTGLHVRAYDPDQVSASNVARQNFAPADVGRNKAVVLIERCNLYAGLRWEAFPHELTPAPRTYGSPSCHVAITCVDSGAARLAVHSQLRAQPPHYWLDCGNTSHSGQVVLGQLEASTKMRLPTILDRDPTGMHGDEPDQPSCSALEALTRQALYINPQVALAAAQLLGDLLLHGRLESAEIHVNLRGNVRAVARPVGRQPVRASFEGLLRLAAQGTA